LRKTYNAETNWSQGSVEALEPETWTTETHFDAMGRVLSRREPDGALYEPIFHISGRLDKAYMTRPAARARLSSTASPTIRKANG